MIPKEWTDEELEERLVLTYAQSDADKRAALLVLLEGANRKWFRTARFRSQCLLYQEADGDVDVWIDWEKVVEMATESGWASSGEQRMLRLACTLAGELPANAGPEWTLPWMVTGLDMDNWEIVRKAILMVVDDTPNAH